MELGAYQPRALNHQMMIRHGELTRDVTGINSPHSLGYRIDPSEHNTFVTPGPSAHSLGMEQREGGGEGIAMNHQLMVRHGGSSRDVTGKNFPNSFGYRMDPSEHNTFVTPGPSAHTLGMEQREGGGDGIARSPM